MNLIERLAALTTPVLAIFAPAGYGKTEFARRYTSRFEHSVSVDTSKAGTARQLLNAVARALGVPAPGEEREDELIAAIASAWEALGSCAIVLDRLDGCDDETARVTLTRLNGMRPEAGRLVLASRREPSVPVTTGINPALVTTLRLPELAISFEELREWAAHGAVSVDDQQLFSVHQLAHGWPVVAEYIIRLIGLGAFDDGVPPLDRSCWTDLWDWMEREVIADLSVEEMGMLLYCAAATDVDESDFAGASRGCDSVYRMLLRQRQLVATGFADEARVLPFLRHFLTQRYAHELQRTAREAAARFSDEGLPIRAARALINVGDCAGASEFVATIGDAGATLGNYAYPGLVLETLSSFGVTYVLYPALWFGLIVARRLVVSPRVLAEEAEDILASAGLASAERARILVVAVILHAVAGQVERAEELATELEGIADGNIVDIARLYIDVTIGNHLSANERWERSGTLLQRNPGAYVMALRMVTRALHRAGSKTKVDEGLRLMWSMAKTSKSPYVAAAAALEIASQAWLCGDEFETKRAAFLDLVGNYDIPLYGRTTAMLCGVECAIDVSDDPVNAVRAFIMLATGAREHEKRVRFALRAVDLSDVARSPYLRVVARVVAYLAGALGTAGLDEARTIACGIGHAELVSAIDAVASGAPDAGILQRNVARFRALQSPVEESPADYIELDFFKRSITRGGSPVHLSERSLSLLVYLEVSRGPVCRERLIDDLWPELDGDAAINALKTCVHRCRQQLGNNAAIRVQRNVFSMGDGIRSNYREIVAMASAEYAVPLDAQARRRLKATFDDSAASADLWGAAWEWFIPHLRVLNDAYRSVGDVLVRDAMARGERGLALQRAHELVLRDPFDDGARLLHEAAAGRAGVPAHARPAVTSR